MIKTHFNQRKYAMNFAENQKQFHEIELIPDIEHLRSKCVANGAFTYVTERPRLLYFNPAFQVYTNSPSAKFLTRVFQRQRQWISQFHQVFPKHRPNLRCVADWKSTDEVTQYERFLSRSACFTGMMFLKGKLLDQRLWEKMLLGVCQKAAKGPSIEWITYNLLGDLRKFPFHSPASSAEIRQMFQSV